MRNAKPEARARNRREYEEQDFVPPEPAYADDLEYMLCSLLWSRKDMRQTYRAEELMCFIDDPGIQNIVFALLSGDEPEALERRWQQMNDMGGMQIIARGNSLLSREGISGEAAEKLMDTLKRKYLETPRLSRKKDKRGEYLGERIR